jgi:hypothetical protein
MLPRGNSNPAEAVRTFAFWVINDHLFSQVRLQETVRSRSR